MLPDELDSLVDSLPAEDELVDASEVAGVVEVVDDSVPVAAPDDSFADGSALELPLDAAWLAAVFFATAVVVVAFFVESAGSCPEASCT